MGKKKKLAESFNEGHEGHEAGDEESDESDLLGAAVDFICESSKAKRQAGLRSLIKYLLLNNDSEGLQKFEITLNNSLFNCMRKGKVEERCQAATAVALLIFRYGDSDYSVELFDKAERYAQRILAETKKDDYSEFIRALVIIYFVTSPDPRNTLDFMSLLLSASEEGKVVDQIATAIRAWTFLFISIPSHDLGGSQLIENALHSMHQHLSSSDTAVRVSAGEAITVIFVRCNLGSLLVDQEFSGKEQDSGLEAILLQMRDIEKNIGEANRKSKKDRTEQRGEFKEYLKIIHGENPKARKIGLPNGQSIVLDSYTDIVTLNMLKDFLGEGFQYHVMTNPIMHNILDFTPVELQIDRGSSIEKVSKQRARNETRRLCAAYKSSIIL